MKISICIPQFNRIEFLLKSIYKINEQTYKNIEIVISDDASSDNTELEINKLLKLPEFNIVYHRFNENVGYDRNLRKSLELATGDYCFILGNDDTLNKNEDIQYLVDYLNANNLPDIGFCNSIDFVDSSDKSIRAKITTIIGTGPEVALKYYSSFSFVAGIIIKKSTFDKFNTSAYDKSIYVQIYLAVMIILNGGIFFTLSDLYIQKDIRIAGSKANSYLDTLPRKWKEYKILDAGLPSYVNVTLSAFNDSNLLNDKYIHRILLRIYLVTYPFWILNYKENNALVAAFGLAKGLSIKSFNKYYVLLPSWKKMIITIVYYLSTTIALLTPVFIFNSFKKILYSLVK